MTYKDPISLDGRLSVDKRWVTQEKMDYTADLLERRARREYSAEGTLKEALTTTELPFNLAQLASINFIENYDEAPREWETVATTRPVNDLKPATLWSLNRSWTNGNGDSGVVTPAGAPVVPEGTVYPYAYLAGQSSEGGKAEKHGFKTDWTLEAQINDGLGLIDELPDAMLEVASDTDEDVVWGALSTQITSASELVGGAIPGGTTVLPNAPFSRDALIRAIIELSERFINGRRIQVRGGYNVVVPVGQGVFAQFILNQTFASVDDGSFTLNIEGYNPLAGVSVVESPIATGNEWYLLPKPGATRRPVLERLIVRGYETPQLFVENLTGNYVGRRPGSAAPWEGSFNADVITLKLRHFVGGTVWDNGLAVVYSDGSGS